MLESHTLSQHIAEQNTNRREWSIHDTPAVIEAYTLEEKQELADAISLFYLIENPDFEVASEIGDVGYLCLKYQEAYGELPETMVAAWSFAQETADLVGLSVFDCIKLKVMRNSWKYSDYMMNNGYGYEEAVKLSKETWARFGGDKKFYEIYSSMEL